MKTRDWYVIAVWVICILIRCIADAQTYPGYDAYEMYDLDMYEQRTFDLIYQNNQPESDDFGDRILERERQFRRQMELEDMERRLQQLEDEDRYSW